MVRRYAKDKKNQIVGFLVKVVAYIDGHKIQNTYKTNNTLQKSRYYNNLNFKVIVQNCFIISIF